MMLTSSQVSIAASSGIVVIFTAALFFSGYVLQQRTLRDLREAIRTPVQPQPQVFLPDRFKFSTTELEDGTIVILDEEPTSGSPKLQQDGQVVIDVKPTVGDGQGTGKQAGDVRESPRPGGDKDAKKEGKEDKKDKKPPKKESPAERRRRIKQEIMKMSHDSRPVRYQRRLW